MASNLLLASVYSALILYAAFAVARRVFYRIEDAPELLIIIASLALMVIVPNPVPVVAGGYGAFRLLEKYLRGGKVFRKRNPIVETMRSPEDAIEVLMAFMGAASDGRFRTWPALRAFFRQKGWGELEETARKYGESGIESIIQDVIDADTMAGNLLSLAFHLQEDVDAFRNAMSVYFRGLVAGKITARYIVGSFLSLLIGLFLLLALFISERIASMGG